jgi:hypothetical protein
MPTQRTLDIWLTIERVDCPVCKARQDTPCRRLDGGEKNRYKNNNAHKARIVTAKKGLTRSCSVIDCGGETWTAMPTHYHAA